MNQQLLEQALDRALARSLEAPQVPDGFRARLMAAAARSGKANLREMRALLETEHRRQLDEMQAGYVRLQWRTLGTLIGAAFATGAVVALALPWIRDNFGANAVFLLPLAGTVIGVMIGARSWLQRSGVMRLLR